MVLRFALAAFLGLSACSDEGGNESLPNPGDVNGPGSSQALRQSVPLNGSFASAIQITGEGWPASTGAQQLVLNFEMEGLAGVRQAELRVRPEPPEAFDLSSAVFAAAQPFVTPFASGIQTEVQDGATVLRMGGASLASAVNDKASLGTLTIRTANSFNSFTDARLVVTSLSLGPSSSQRDSYDAQTLNLGVVVAGN